MGVSAQPSRSLRLSRPLAFFDLETTGTDVSQDRIVEIAVLKLLTDGTEEIFQSLINGNDVRRQIQYIEKLFELAA